MSVEFDPQSALGYAEAALAAFQCCELSEGRPAALGLLGMVWEILGESHQAVPLFEQSIGLALNAGYYFIAAAMLTHLSRANRAKGLGLWDHALTLIRNADDPELLSQTLDMLTATLLAEGDFEKAIEVGHEGLELAQRDRQELLPWNQISTLQLKLGIGEYHLGHYDIAVHHLEASLRVEREKMLDLPLDRAMCYYFLAYVALARGNRAEAEHHSREGLHHVAGTLDLITVVVLAQQAHLALRDGDTVRAGRLFGSTTAE